MASPLRETPPALYPPSRQRVRQKEHRESVHLRGDSNNKKETNSGGRANPLCKISKKYHRSIFPGTINRAAVTDSPRKCSRQQRSSLRWLIMDSRRRGTPPAIQCPRQQARKMLRQMAVIRMNIIGREDRRRARLRAKESKADAINDNKETFNGQ